MLIQADVLIKEPDGPRTPIPWELNWRVTIGPLIETGKGILSKNIWDQKHLIEKFEVLFDGVTVVLNLKDGTTWFCPNGASPELQYKPDFPPNTTYQLIWFRRMAKEMAEYDSNTDTPKCLCYGVGWQVNVDGKNHKYGYTIDPYGDFYLGLP